MNVHVSARNGTREFACEPGEKILHAGLRSGVELPDECATGTCGTCKATLLGGLVESEWPEAPGGRYLKSAAELLMCQSVARDACRLEVAIALKAPEPPVPAPRTLGGIVRAPRRLTHDVVAFDLDLDEPIDFEAGQFALLTMPGIRGARAYSMVNFDHGAARLSFVVKKKPGGAVSEGLFGHDGEGARRRVFAPAGQAIFHPDTRKHILCIAGQRDRGNDVDPCPRLWRRSFRGLGWSRLLRCPHRARRLLSRRARGVPVPLSGAAGHHGGPLRRRGVAGAGRRLSGLRVRRRPRPRGGR